MKALIPTFGWRNRGYKYIPSELTEQILEALSFFPVLNDVEIDFQIKESLEGGVMRVKPKMSSYITTRKSYIIEIRQFVKVNHRVIPIQNLPPDVVVGWMGYELARVVEMMNHNLLHVYNTNKGLFETRKAALTRERMINVHAIQSGIADKVLSARDYVLKICGVSVADDSLRKHMSPEDTLNLLHTQSKTRGDLIFTSNTAAFQTWNGW